MNSKYAFLMVNYEMPELIKELQNSITDEELYNEDGFGMEYESHVTLVPCMDNDVDINHLKTFLLPLMNYQAKLKGINIFENDKCDVLKCDIDCENLRHTNNKIRNIYPIYSEYTEYQPHMTIAYLKKGCGKKYIKQFDTPIDVMPYSFHWSYYDNNDNNCEIFF